MNNCIPNNSFENRFFEELEQIEQVLFCGDSNIVPQLNNHSFQFITPTKERTKPSCFPSIEKLTPFEQAFIDKHQEDLEDQISNLESFSKEAKLIISDLMKTNQDLRNENELLKAKLFEFQVPVPIGEVKTSLILTKSEKSDGKIDESFDESNINPTNSLKFSPFSPSSRFHQHYSSLPLNPTSNPSSASSTSISEKRENSHSDSLLPFPSSLSSQQHEQHILSSIITSLPPSSSSSSSSSTSFSTSSSSSSNSFSDSSSYSLLENQFVLMKLQLAKALEEIDDIYLLNQSLEKEIRQEKIIKNQLQSEKDAYEKAFADISQKFHKLFMQTGSVPAPALVHPSHSPSPFSSIPVSSSSSLSTLSTHPHSSPSSSSSSSSSSSTTPLPTTTTTTPGQGLGQGLGLGAFLGIGGNGFFSSSSPSSLPSKGQGQNTSRNISQ